MSWRGRRGVSEDPQGTSLNVTEMRRAAVLHETLTVA